MYYIIRNTNLFWEERVTPSPAPPESASDNVYTVYMGFTRFRHYPFPPKTKKVRFPFPPKKVRKPLILIFKQY
jgi:hypothetical protein